MSLNHLISRFILHRPLKSQEDVEGVGSAVLIPIINKSEPTVLFTTRSMALRHHAGQVAFPGGKVDDTDADITATALREADEEIGLKAKDISVLGCLPTFNTRTGYNVTGIVALLPDNLLFKLNKDEVDSLFEVPLSLLLNPNNFTQQRFIINGKPHLISGLVYQQHFIWGVTAQVLNQLAEHINISDEYPS